MAIIIFSMLYNIVVTCLSGWQLDINAQKLLFYLLLEAKYV